MPEGAARRGTEVMDLDGIGLLPRRASRFRLGEPERVKG